MGQKLKNSNETFWVIFKQYEAVAFLKISLFNFICWFQNNIDAANTDAHIIIPGSANTAYTGGALSDDSMNDDTSSGAIYCKFSKRFYYLLDSQANLGFFFSATGVPFTLTYAATGDVGSGDTGYSLQYQQTPCWIMIANDKKTTPFI